MRTLRKFWIVNLMVFSLGEFNGQAVIILNRDDSYKLQKQKVYVEPNLMLYKNQYTLTISDSENIKNNIKNNLRTYTRVDGKKYCDGCKTENYYYAVEKVKKSKIINTYRKYKLQEFLKPKDITVFYETYFLIEKKYYKNIGKILVD